MMKIILWNSTFRNLWYLQCLWFYDTWSWRNYDDNSLMILDLLLMFKNLWFYDTGTSRAYDFYDDNNDLMILDFQEPMISTVLMILWYFIFNNLWFYDTWTSRAFDFYDDNDLMILNLQEPMISMMLNFQDSSKLLNDLW